LNHSNVVKVVFGRPSSLAAVRREFGIQAEKHASADGATFSHSSFIYLIDRGGRLRALMPYGHTPDDFAHDVGILLAE
jgi:protein SCO1/2